MHLIVIFYIHIYSYSVTSPGTKRRKRCRGERELESSPSAPERARARAEHSAERGPPLSHPPPLTPRAPPPARAAAAAVGDGGGTVAGQPAHARARRADWVPPWLQRLVFDNIIKIGKFPTRARRGKIGTRFYVCQIEQHFVRYWQAFSLKLS